jgi:hypothetical protein
MTITEIEPHWLKSVHTHGLDHLGMQIVSITIYGDLLPGLTNVTDRIRYYSFFPWLLYRYAKDIGSTSLLKWQEHLRRAEFLLALVGKAHHKAEPEGGEAIVGADQAADALKLIRENPSKQWNLSQWTAVAQVGKAGSYFKNKNGGYGQYYRRTLSELGLIAIVDEALGINLHQDAGLALAEICDAQPRRQDFWKAVVDNEVSLALIEDLGKSLCPCTLTGFKEECQFLTTLMFGPDGGKSGTGDRRARSLRLLLAMLDQFGCLKDPVAEFRLLAYYGHSVSGQAFVPPHGLEEVLQKWLTYQAGEYVHYSLEQTFLAVLSVLKTSPREEAGLHGFLRELALKSLSVSSATLGLGADKRPWADRLLGDLLEEARTGQAPLGKWFQDPWAESKLIPNPKEETPSEVLARAFASLLSVLARNRVPVATFAGFESLDTSFLRRYPVNFASFRDWMFKSTKSKATDVYVDILSNWVIGQHLRVAMRKLRYQTQATFKIAVEEGHYIWIEDFVPTYTGPRLRQAFRFIRDLGLCSSAKDGWRITEAGMRQLEGSDGK